MHLLFYLFLVLLLNIMIWDNLFSKGSCVKKMSWNLLWQLQIKKKRSSQNLLFRNWEKPADSDWIIFPPEKFRCL